MDERRPSNSPNDWQVLSDAFDELAEAAPAVRQARLDELKQTRPELALELDSLLHSLDSQPDFLQRPALDWTEHESGDGSAPERIGPYVLLERVGQGGMGRVYRARRDDGALEQEVAIKIVQAGVDDPHHIERFAREARLLSRLDHPGIARPLDAGLLDKDRAYLVMEFVDGVPIDRYCREQALDKNEIIELLIQVCEAVQFAHRNLIVHRDIKPANVLVDRQGRARLLDFGIARLLESDDADLTRTGQLALTPRYASPEQLTGEAITTASDVHALGALAYQLLCGRPPLDLDGLSLPALIDRVTREQPAKASEAAADTRLAGDLDAILAMALRKEPGRRYASAGALADDLQRHLRGEPVQAHPDELGYRLGKFFRRHRGGVIAGLLTAVALIGLASIASLQALRADQARSLAVQEADRANQVLAYFQQMLASVRPATAQGEDVRVRDLLDRTASTLAEADLDPLARASVQETVASTYLALGLPQAGLPLAEAASATLESTLGADDPRSLSARHAEARFHLYQAHWDEAIAILEPTFERRRAVLGDHMDTMSSLHNLAMAYAGRGEVERALEMDLIQLAIVERLSGPDSAEALTTLSSVAHGYFSLGRMDEARDTFGRIHAGQRELLGERHPTTLSALHNYATLLRRTGEIDQAESRYLELIALRREVLGDRHAQTLNSLNNLGELYLHTDRPDRAAPFIEEALAGRMAAMGEAHPDSIDSLVANAKLRLAQGRIDEALPLAQRAHELAEAHLPADGEHLDKARKVLAEAREALRLDDALQP
ncbi:serine/threonine-protein kinase [Wenzhouxiangella marina]|uniref:Uncharacterized protein n=1 Tax=Wenzhouxiangella marina TaxID=1579979 RepID=A0A0K0XZP8_9GAMM|nr:serine/threonine-protein kinase [Wenzhouxiangella marina]AKS43145.1 hypothetical protein WM2015_2788 [Wenzhouxiangella marina]MBB6087170.1 tetratricopeptide (TPR) repeat protein/predicted Ser/Thr protein kinase [Wenzhouxiangella marina]